MRNGAEPGPQSCTMRSLDSNGGTLVRYGGGKCLNCFGGPEGIRTLDLFHAMEARSQLRHRPSHLQSLLSLAHGNVNTTILVAHNAASICLTKTT